MGFTSNDLDRLKRRVPDASNDMLLGDLLEDAEKFALAYTGRDEIPAALNPAVVQLAAAMYNRLGAEGESAHSEGGVSHAFEGIPADIRAQLNPYRLAKTLQ